MSNNDVAELDPIIVRAYYNEDDDKNLKGHDRDEQNNSSTENVDEEQSQRNEILKQSLSKKGFKNIKSLPNDVRLVLEVYITNYVTPPVYAFKYAEFINKGDWNTFAEAILYKELELTVVNAKVILKILGYLKKKNAISKRLLGLYEVLKPIDYHGYQFSEKYIKYIDEKRFDNAISYMITNGGSFFFPNSDDRNAIVEMLRTHGETLFQDLNNEYTRAKVFISEANTIVSAQQYISHNMIEEFGMYIRKLEWQLKNDAPIRTKRSLEIYERYMKDTTKRLSKKDRDLVSKIAELKNAKNIESELIKMDKFFSRLKHSSGFLGRITDWADVANLFNTAMKTNDYRPLFDKVLSMGIVAFYGALAALMTPTTVVGILSVAILVVFISTLYDETLVKNLRTYFFPKFLAPVPN